MPYSSLNSFWRFVVSAAAVVAAATLAIVVVVAYHSDSDYHFPLANNLDGRAMVGMYK